MEHANGMKSKYGHLSTIDVKKDTMLKKGQQLGKVGSTGQSEGPHLHLDIINPDGSYLNPRDYVKNIPYNWKLLYLGSSMHNWRLDKRCHHNIEKKYCTTNGSIAGAFAVGIDHSVYNDLLHLIKYSYKI